ncbi:hypothetical protein GCM10008938_44750 [Deinococcus roseus]|uniref:Uncharacterized protein n=1 Tax=Deinococcus roseus TaxID=392414 RepID=A0ABQ2DD04_9DEIO|nr:hypothetical protein GCM10008938_44750 [Deinococcus roseus]
MNAGGTELKAACQSGRKKTQGCQGSHPEMLEYHNTSQYRNFPSPQNESVDLQLETPGKSWVREKQAGTLPACF